MLPHHSLSFALLLFLSIFVFNVTAANNKLPKGFSIDLIHRDSPLSPFYNSSMTRSERFQKAALRSMSRANRFGQSSTAETSELVETDIFPNDASYLMKISVGTPPVERLALADTGSDLIWFQCSPCPKCYPQNAPLFDPKSSSTYMTLLCGSDPCNSLPKSLCKANCILNVEHQMEQRRTCWAWSGNLSLVSQMGNVGRKFSYCLPPYSAKTTTKLRFGEEAAISGNGVVSTPLITKPGSLSSFYFLNLEGITVGQQTVRTGQSNGNIFIDSGTTLTMLPSSFYEQIEALVKQAIGANQFIVQNNHYKLCYRNANSIQNFPNFEVHFTGANLSLKPQNFFRRIYNDVICFAMLPTDGMPIYGNMAQINFEVEHDLDQKKLSFAPGDCTKQ
ncbi:aspartic proteinase CDR1-like [Neltuma alba]|uniref:aspartic proteinase CDR1-like n=1 Tax=Neltuma alba TaxID=207710 RepID=UPI0010A3ED4A|nr:aspartic proteinase CDR1-like [Prosopis alba]